MKVPEPRKLSSGTWFIQLRLGGESIPVTSSNKKECIRKAELIKAEHRTGRRSVRLGDITLSQAIDQYIGKRSNVLSPATVRGYRRIQKGRLKAVMDAPLKSVKDWQTLINNESIKYAPKTMRNTWGLISAVLRDQRIDVPEIKLPQPIPKEKEFLEPDQLKPFLAAAEGAKGELACILALHGLRRSEILALTKDDIDLTAGTIHVRGAVVQAEDNTYVHKDSNKNETSTRPVPIMIPRLRELVEAAPDGALVSCYPGTITNRINAICRAADLPEVGTHGLRHSFASLAYHLGLSERQTMELGGWADAGTMRKIYTHLAQLDRAKSRNVLTEFFDPQQADAEEENRNANKNAKRFSGFE